MQYTPASIEPKWQEQWEKQQAFTLPTDLKTLSAKPKYYILDMFPYPSGAGLHVGHPEGYTATDIVARMKSMQGFNVLHPMGWDAFGLPAERSAVRENIHPAIITERNINNFRRQLKRLGFNYDWSREVNTSHKDYYHWTQWIFLKLYERNLAYMAEVPVNWCPALGTVLANEEVKDGHYVETGDPVERRLMRQWMLKITVYAERLIQDLDELNWPENIKMMQREWIGKSTGAEITFQVKDTSESFTVFTTRPDTLFGATFCVLAPEHPLVLKIASAAQKSSIQKYLDEVKNKTELQRTDLAKGKSGVFTGAHAVHPVTLQPIPIWVADYVLMTYGTGSIMAVPAHDERDQEFAKCYQLPIIEVIKDDVAIQSDFINGLAVEPAKQKIITWLEQNKKGAARTTYRLRDWLFSRQRYWGEPFPILHSEKGEVIPLAAELLPVELPPIDEYKPTATGEPPLARAPESWSQVTLPNGQKGKRETNTMPQWAGSCWYYLRYIDPKNPKEAWNRDLEKYWMPVDLYVGGVEHAVLHLLYARFWHKVLYDCGLVTTKEPFTRLFNPGMILAHSYRDSKGKYFSPNEVEDRQGKSFVKGTQDLLEVQIEKMSKSKYNVVNPDDVIDQYGADSMRLYEMFMGPLDQVKPWKTDGVEGCYRFLSRVWRLVVDEKTGTLASKVSDTAGNAQGKLWKMLHQTIKKVTEDIEGMRFNTAISQMMIFVNEATSAQQISKEVLFPFLQILSPFAPHLAEELWQKLGKTELICKTTWPKFDPALCTENTVTIVVQLNGKLVGKIETEKGADQTRVEAQTKSLPKLANITPKKIIYVPDRLINYVA